MFGLVIIMPEFLGKVEMHPRTQKILSRLAYEKLLMTSDITPRRMKVTLEDALQAGAEEPCVFEVLPAALLHKPSIFNGIARDVAKYPDIQNISRNLFDPKLKLRFFHGVAIEDCRKAARAFSRFLDIKRRRHKFLTLNLRLSTEDRDRLLALSRDLGTKNVSETIRQLAKEKYESLLSKK